MNIRRMIRVSWPTLLACFSLVWMVSCDMDNDNEVQTIPTAFVSIYNASPNAPALDVVVDSRQINSNPFDYADYSGYLKFYTGNRNLQFSPFDADNVVIDSTITFEDQKVYSLFIVDNYEKAELLVLNDNSDEPASGKAKIRFVNLSPDVNDISLKAEGQTDPLFAGQSFKEASAFTEVDAKSYNLKITTDTGGTVVLDLPNKDFQSGGFYTIIVRGYKTPPSGNTNVLSAEVIINN